MPEDISYNTNNIILLIYLRLTNYLIRIFNYNTPPKIPSHNYIPNNILISNIAHIGDVLLITGIIKSLRDQYPLSKIGLLTGSCARGLVERNIKPDYCYFFDHFKLNRGSKTTFLKFINHFLSLILSTYQIRKINYDIFIDFYAFYPNSIFLSSLCRIKYRIGYINGGFSNLLNCGVAWNRLKGHVTEQHQKLLAELNPSFLHLNNRPYLKKGILTSNTLKALKKNLSYVVFHMGSGSMAREWNLENWRKLVEIVGPELHKNKLNIIFTGLSQRELKDVNFVISDLKFCINLVNRLSWDDYVSVLSNAQLVVGVESLACHLASALDVKFLVLKSGITSNQWAPVRVEGSEVIAASVPCSPCHQKNGCLDMMCMSLISPSLVHSEILKLLNIKTSSD